MAKKRKHEEHENHERWLVSYADFLTLLFAFFVVMYSVSKVDNKRIIEATESIRWAMHYEGTGGTGALPLFDGPPSSEGGGPAMRTGSMAQPPQIHKRLEQLRSRIQKRVRPWVSQSSTPDAVTVALEGRRIAIRLAAMEFFEPGFAVLRPQVLAVLDAIAEEIVPLGRLLRVEGHTDETPTDGERFRNNWELSAARAATVVTYLEQAHGADPRLLAAVGLGAAHPVADDPSAERNRRVEIVIELSPSDPLLGGELE
ncbi:MAG TPA: flagellar motor protein MotB [Anaeromyxobacteraceae bacterium]|nr:flagellar motor protein MotB [Anaeromyxobacteraceae bacterium]